MIDDAEFEKRKAAWTAPAPRYSRGFGAIYAQHVTQADQGCDFEILRDGEAVPEPEIH
jgi:dihydroxy-acid dehydratase